MKNLGLENGRKRSVEFRVASQCRREAGVSGEETVVDVVSFNRRLNGVRRADSYDAGTQWHVGCFNVRSGGVRGRRRSSGNVHEAVPVRSRICIYISSHRCC